MIDDRFPRHDRASGDPASLAGSALLDPPSPADGPSARLSSGQAWTLIAIVGGGLLVTIVAAWLFGAVYHIDPDGLRAWLDRRGPIAPLLYVALLASAIVISPIPSVPLNVAAGLAFGLLWGSVYTIVGIEIGGVTAFLIARHLGRPAVVRYVPAASIEFVDRLADRLGWRGIFFVRLVPLFHFDWISYAAGLTRMSFLSFSTASLAGIIVPVIGVVAVGDSLVTNPARAATIVGGLVLLGLAPFAWAGIARRRSRTVAGVREEPSLPVPPLR